MIVQADNNRCIFWGTELTSEYLYAELAYFGSNLPKSVRFTDENGNRIKIEIPESQQWSALPGKAQDIYLKRISE